MAIKETAKAVTPPTILRGARTLRQRLRKLPLAVAKQTMAWKAPILHRRLLTRYRCARPIRVMFLIHNTGSWKVGPIFARMMDDPDFQPLAAVCPTTGGELAAVERHTADLARRYLEAQGFPYVDFTVCDAEQTRAEIHKLNPHLVFFTDPYKAVPKHLRHELLASRLTCYVPYHHQVMSYANNHQEYNKDSDNAFWRIFVPHEESRRNYGTNRIRGDAGVIVTGFPACEPLLDQTAPRYPSPWKLQERPKKRVIYAPHWLWSPDMKMATIDTFGAVMLRIAERYRDDVQWALRPHPNLRPRLMKDSEWGPERTKKFFDFWQNSDFCQIHEDNYIPLFQTSDAMIHDSGSFLAEYLYLRKPVMYLMSEQTSGKYFNDFGRRAITACDVGRSAKDIEEFLERLLMEDTKNIERDRFFNEEILNHFKMKPSVKICQEIKNAFS
ncbi:UDP-N-acetyl glucosamine 2-epimerase [Roseovarius sp. A21]|uniref:UDP-N-acetyl glucosamine 2-epimerase n=1 Tax=Roseovarius bejariae TaxID=2576383 RepID=A0A844CK28_9RHOB|nr:CDP-glycerol glycerophosphotransferase family protein [Roseovarius bejariae]MRU15681.1 UDP-N-acetyl glucosamine 2-epimerase [Roseovarius bejariae]